MLLPSARNELIDVIDPAPQSRTFALPSAVVAMLSVVTAGVVVAFLYFARDIIIPVTLAMLLSFLLAPAVRWLRRLGAGRVTAITFTVLIALLAILGFATIVVREVSTLAEELPQYRYNLETKVRSLPGAIPGGGVFRRVSAMFRDLHRELTRSQTESAPPANQGSLFGATSGAPTQPVPVEIRQPELGPLEIVQSVVGPLLQPLAMAGLVIVFAVMIMLEREDLRDRLLRLAGRDLHRTTVAMDDAAQRISRYLLRQLVVNSCCGVPIGLGLAVIGIPNAALWGMLAALLRFIPYLGIIIAACFPLALAIAVDPGWTMLVWVVLLFVAIEFVVANLLEPWVYGASTGLSPVALIAAATFWTFLWGPIGLLLSTPMTVCLVVLGRHVPQLEFLDVMLGNEPVLAPGERFYQRLLANDPEEASEQAEEFISARSVAEFFDEIAIPALDQAQIDSDRGVLTAERRTIVRESVRALLENISDAAEDSGSEAAPQPEIGEARIACVAGRNELDEAAALLLVHLLRSEHLGGVVEALSADALALHGPTQPPLLHAHLVCLSLISTSSPARARYLERRLRRRAPRAKVLIGLWGTVPGEPAATGNTPARPESLVVTSLREAVSAIHAAETLERMPAQAG
jgi:predicted PurR-regulated permease PerM